MRKESLTYSRTWNSSTVFFLFINGSTALMRETLKYVLTEISTILPLEVLDNIIVVFTNTTDQIDLNFDPSELRRFFGKDIEHDRIFLINNPYCRVDKLQSRKKDSKMFARRLKESFDEARDMLTSMCGIIKHFRKVCTHHLVTLYEAKQQIEGEVTDLLIICEDQMELEKKISLAEEETEAALRALKLSSGDTEVFYTYVQVESEKCRVLCSEIGCCSVCHTESIDTPLAFSLKHCGLMQSNSYCKNVGIMTASTTMTHVTIRGENTPSLPQKGRENV